MLTLAWRILYERTRTDSEFGRLIDFIKKHKKVFDEIWLFDSITHHLYIPIKELERRGRRFEYCIKKLKEIGVKSVGINVLCTIGHVNEAWDYNPALPFQPMVGHDGSVSKSCACPNAPEFRAYVRRKYVIMAKAKPDFIMVDDDIRMQHHGVTWGCFCPVCMKIFSKSVEKKLNRKTLTEKLDSPDGGSLREAWVEQNITTLENLIKGISLAIKSVNPAIGTGLMTAGAQWSSYSGSAFGRWFRALNATRSRPGGGYYDDRNRLGIIDKILETGIQRAHTPSSVLYHLYELENFPYQKLQKSAETVANESTLALAVGLNGIAFNALGITAGSMEDYHCIPEKAKKMRPVWEAMVKHSAGMRNAGLFPVWTPSIMAKRKLRKGEKWFGYQSEYNFSKGFVFAEIGLPVSCDAGSSGNILCGRIPELLDKRELLNILSSGVVMDGTAVISLTERGLGDLTGIKIKKRLDNGVIERFNDDAMNGIYRGEKRDARIEFWGNAIGLADDLSPVKKGVRVLTRMENYYGRQVGIGMTAYENELGGRVVVMGYAPWMFIHSSAKRVQLQNVADWITRGKMPVRIDETETLTPIVRLSEDRGKGMVVLFNHGFAEIPEVTVHVRAPLASACIATEKGLRHLKVRKEKNGWAVKPGPIPGWSCAVILFTGIL